MHIWIIVYTNSTNEKSKLYAKMTTCYMHSIITIFFIAFRWTYVYASPTHRPASRHAHADPPPPRSTLLARIVIAGYFPRLAKTLKIQRLSQSRRPKGNDEQQRASQAGITSSGAGGRVRGGRRGGQRRQAWRVSSGSLRAPLLGRRRAPGALALRLRQETTRSFG